ncbi:MAG: hypothetical protein AAF916_03895 [Planctomycetota bacterium]
MPDTETNAAFNFRWIEDWARIPDTASGRKNGRTHGVEVLPDGRVAVFHQATPAMLFFEADGSLSHAWGDRFLGAHGMTLTEHDGQPAFWLVDEFSCEVVKTTLDGETILRITAPPIDARPDGKYVPTWADQHPETGDIWVGDGYGGSTLHRFNARGRHLEAITKIDGVRLNEPHGLRISPEGELWLTDRANHRIVVLDADGKLVRSTRSACHSPTSIAFHDGRAYIAELFGAVRVLDRDLNRLATLGENPWLTPEPGWEDRPTWWWPDAQTQEGYPNFAGTERVQPGKFISPHGIAVGPDGAVFITEWTLGGRILKLEPDPV